MSTARSRPALTPLVRRDVAVCISGTPRNLGRQIPRDVARWPSAKYKTLPKEQQDAFFKVMDDEFAGNMSAVDTIRRFLYPSLRVFDIFMHVPSRFGGVRGKLRAERACSFFRPQQSGSRLVCRGGPDIQMNSSNLAITPQDFAWLETHSLWPLDKVINQWRGQALCAKMITDAVRHANVQYTWILRLRADLILFAPAPTLYDLPERPSSVVYFQSILDMNASVGCDMFNIGRPSMMRKFLAKFQDMSAFIQALRTGGTFLPGDAAHVWFQLVGGGEFRALPRKVSLFPWRELQLRWKNPYVFPTTSCAVSN
eukprot:TRINITY_DN115180_c0_g1_i1.p1 TRINITY_DN115180_c0_g1~~TRINITY_DN115180_c0_g1_i1.p1  ORF type:complete len:312 (-),score=18.93 TRINITY_DN115180_c0_g1_i1:95-1030(-)